MRCKHIYLAFAIAACVIGPAAPESSGDGALLRVGSFHGNEVSAESGQTWWGVFPNGGGFEVRRCTIRVEIVEDGIVDEPGQKTGKEITVDEDAAPLFLFRGVPGAAAGPIETYFRGPKFAYPGEQIVCGSDGGPFISVGAIGRAEEGEFGPVIRDYALKLYRRDSSGTLHGQTLRAFDEVSIDGQPELIWSGDLDRDGIPDFLFDLRWHYNVSDMVLFISSEAAPGECAGVAAELVTTGC